jgi:hypothetical protein
VVGHLLRGVQLLSAHRGCAPSRLSAALAVALSREVPADDKFLAKADCDVLVGVAAVAPVSPTPVALAAHIVVSAAPDMSSGVRSSAVGAVQHVEGRVVAHGPTIAHAALAAVDASVDSVADVSAMDVSGVDVPVPVPSTVRALLAMPRMFARSDLFFSLRGVVETVELLPLYMRFRIFDLVDLSERLEVRYYDLFADGAAPRPGDRVQVVGHVRLWSFVGQHVRAHRILVDR